MGGSGMWLFGLLLAIGITIGVEAPRYVSQSVAAAQQNIAVTLQPPTPSAGARDQPPKPETTQNKEESKEDQHGTDQVPLIVKVAPSPSAYPESAEQRQASEDKTAEDRWPLRFAGYMTLFTGLLVIVGAGQLIMFFKQLRLIRDGMNDAKIAAEAARDAAIAAQETLKSNRAWMCMSQWTGASIGNAFIDGVHIGETYGFSIVWENSGRSPALDFNIYTEIKTIGRDDELPTFDVSRGLVQDIRAILGPGKQGASLIKPLPSDEYHSFKNRERHVVLYCLVNYRDIFDTTIIRRSEVCLKLSCVGDMPDATGRTMPYITGGPVGPQNSAS
jgi:hypothetical protein